MAKLSLNRRRNMLILGAIPVLLIVGYATWNLGFFAKATGDVMRMSRAELSSYSQKKFAEFPEVNLAKAGSPGEIASLLLRDANASRSSDAPSSQREREALAKITAEFIFLRYGRASLDDYKEWRTAGGYKLIPTDTLIRGYTMPRDYETIFDEPYPGDTHLEEVFDRFFEHGTSGSQSRSRASAIIDSPTCIAISLGSITKETGLEWPTADSDLGPDVWYGRISSTLRNWWSTPHSEDFMGGVRETGEVPVAMVSVVLRFSPDRQFPVHLDFYQDPETGSWWLRAVHVNNDMKQIVGTTEI